MTRSLLVLAIVLAACTAPASGPPVRNLPAPVPPTPTKSSAAPPREVPKPVRVARDTLARHAGVAVEDVEVVDWVTDTFPLDNLGCPAGPEKGAVRPAIVAGHEVTLRVGGKTYLYRVRGRRAVLCQGPD